MLVSKDSAPRMATIVQQMCEKDCDFNATSRFKDLSVSGIGNLLSKDLRHYKNYGSVRGANCFRRRTSFPFSVRSLRRSGLRNLQQLVETKKPPLMCNGGLSPLTR